MKLHELLAKEELDGELVFNGMNFDMTCSLYASQTIVGAKAFELYGKVLNGEVVKVTDDNYYHVVNAEIEDNDKPFSLGKEFLMAISGYIGEKLYEECFPEYEEPIDENENKSYEVKEVDGKFELNRKKHNVGIYETELEAYKKGFNLACFDLESWN